MQGAEIYANCLLVATYVISIPTWSESMVMVTGLASIQRSMCAYSRSYDGPVWYGGLLQHTIRRVLPIGKRLASNSILPFF
jgi:hypothetical protein